MGLRDDIASPSLLRLKGGLFLFLGAASSALLLAEDFSLRRVLLLALAVWSFCRFYYFLFYVLEAYAGRQRQYAGLLDALRWALRGKERR